jgi:hypothetical protein
MLSNSTRGGAAENYPAQPFTTGSGCRLLVL